MKYIFRVSFILFGVVYGQSNFAQSFEINTETFSATLNADDPFFLNGNDAGLLTPEGHNILFTLSFMYHNLGSDGVHRGGGDAYGNSDFFSLGTINEDAGRAVAPFVKVTRNELLVHQESFQNPNYQMPEGIANWPANGDTTIGELWEMAPYIDANGNEVYDPENGDYPNIIGDEFVYKIVNNEGTLRSLEGLTAEIHTTLSFFKDRPAPLRNSILLTTTVYNRGEEPWDTLKTGYFLDADIGTIQDDRFASSETTGAICFYNDGFDSQLGERPHALAFGSLFCASYAGIATDLSGFAFNGYPAIGAEFGRVLEGKWRDNSCLIDTGNGHISGVVPGAEHTRFLYRGAPDLSNSWNETTQNLISGDRQGISVMRPRAFIAPGSKTTFVNTLYFGGIENGSAAMNAVEAMSSIGAIEDLVDQEFRGHPFIEAARACDFPSFEPQCAELTTIEELNGEIFKVVPNPVLGGSLQLHISKALNSVHLVATNGETRQISGSLSSGAHQLIVPEYSGLYMLQLLYKDGTSGTKKIQISN